jgi:hypothetical protein
MRAMTWTSGFMRRESQRGELAATAANKHQEGA